ncbi:MAG: phage tail sheath protein [Fusobacteriaceae bacterium]
MFKMRMTKADVGQILPTPSIKVAFETKARVAIQKGERGIVVVILEDTTSVEPWTTLKSVSDIAEDKWTAENVMLLNSVYEVFPPSRVLVRRRASGESVTVIQKELESLNFTQVAFADITAEDDALMVSFAKTRVDKKGEVYVSALATNSDSVCVVELANHTTMTHKTITNFSAQKATLMIAGAIAGCPLNQSLDNIILPNVTDISVVEPSLGKFTFLKDDDLVRVNLSVNSKTTFDSVFAPASRYIKIWDGMSTIKNDIEKTFRDYYLGKYLNSYDNKVAFMNNVEKVYFKELQPNVLSADYNNSVSIDVEANKRHIITDGNDPDKMSETEIKVYPTAESVYLVADIKLQNTMINLAMTINY